MRVNVSGVFTSLCAVLLLCYPGTSQEAKEKAKEKVKEKAKEIGDLVQNTLDPLPVVPKIADPVEPEPEPEPTPEPTPTPTPEPFVCPQGWKEYKPKNKQAEKVKCFHVNNTLMTLKESKAYCEKVAHRQVTITTRAEGDVLYHLTNHKIPYWLGLEWHNDKGAHYWNTGTTMEEKLLLVPDSSYQSWGQYNKSAGHCRSIVMRNALWYEVACLTWEEHRAFTICELFEPEPNSSPGSGLWLAALVFPLLTLAFL